MVITFFVYRATDKSSEIAEKSMRIANRAYLSIKDINPQKIKNFSNVKIKITITNTGQTPAYNITSMTVISIIKTLPDTLPTPPKIFKSSNLLGKNGTFNITLEKTFNENQIKRIKNQEFFLNIVGTIEYRDIFKKEQFFEFNLFYSIGADAFTYCPKHNDAS